MSDTYKLQLRHGAESKNFSTRDEVAAYIQGQVQYGGVSLLPYEPVLFFYGEEGSKNAIILVGLPEGQTQGNKTYFMVDTADLQEQIDNIDGKYASVIEELKATDEELKVAIKTETEARIAADEAEANERIAADEAEAEARIAADEAETEARIAADETETIIREEQDKILADAIAAEAEERTKKDEELQEEISFSKDDIKSVIEACGLIYNEKLAEDRVSYSPDIHDEVIRDAKDITEAIDKVSKFAAMLAKDLKVTVKDTDTVKLNFEPNEKEGGNTISADVKIAGTNGLSKGVEDNNIIGKTTDGLYASTTIETSTKNPNKLIFKTSGYIDGKFVTDAFEKEIELPLYTGDTGKHTGITVSIDTDKNIIGAELNLSSDKNNILKLEDGEYIVDGTAKNIKYGESTVAATLKGQANRLNEIEESIDFVKNIEIKGSDTDTTSVSVNKSAKGDFIVSSDVRLSDDRSIIIKNGGLKADVDVDFNEVTSKMKFRVGNKETEMDLSTIGVSFIKDARYDSAREIIILVLTKADGSEMELEINVSDLVHDLKVVDTDTIDLSLGKTTDGNVISAKLRVDNSHSDNLVTVNSNGVYVSKSHITNAVKEESDARKDADNELKAKLTEVSTLANINKEAIAQEAATARAAEKANADAIAQEIKDARAAEKVNADAIEKNEKSIKDNEKVIADEISRANNAEQELSTAITAEETRAKEAEVKNANAIASEIDRAVEKESDLLEKIGDNTTKINENKTAIAAESERADKAEKSLKDSIDANASAISTESERAKLAEQANATAVESEKTRAQAAENANATAIATETGRATTAEGELKAAIDANKAAIADAKAVADQVKTDLANEVTRAQAAEGANATAITTETDRATTAEGELKAAVDANKAEVASAKEIANQTKADLANEVTRAKAAEEVNATAIVTETDRATTAEGELKTDIDANKVAIADAKAVADQVKTDLTNEVTRAKAAEGANSTAIVTEADRAKHAETDLLEKINNNTASIESISTEVGNIELKKEGELSYALYVNGTKHGEFTIPKDQFLKSVNYDATTKELVFVFDTTSGETTTRISIADLIDTYEAGEGLTLSGNVFSVDFAKVASIESVKASIDVETLRAKAAEEANSAAIVSENTRAELAESNLKTAIDENKAEVVNAKAVADQVKADLANEVTRAKGAEEANSIAIVTETNRAVTAEGELAVKIVKNTTDIENNALNISNEVTRATAAEADLTNNLANEVIRAKAAEEANSTAIATEKARAEEKEADLLEKINQTSAEIEVITTEIGDIQLTKEGELSYALYVNGTKHGEITIPKDQFLKSVNYDTTTKELVFVFNTTSGETTTRISIADLIDTYQAGEGLVLSGNVFSVNFDKIPTFDNLDGAVNAEKIRAKAAEAELTTGLSNEVIRAKAAEEANATAIANEKSRAEEKENDLDSRLTETQTNLNNVDGKVTLNTLNINTLQNKLEIETTRAILAEESNATAIITEKNRAMEAEKVLSENISKQEAYTAKVESDLTKNIEKTEINLQAAKDELNSSINQKANSADVYTKEETLERLSDYAKNAEVQSKLDEKLNSTDASNVYATKDALQEVKDAYATVDYVNNADNGLDERITNNKNAIDNFNLTFNGATSELVYTDKNGVAHSYNLYSGSLIKKGEFDPKSNSVVLTIENAGIESQITIPVSELMSDLADKIQNNSDNIQKINEALSKLAKDWTTVNSSSIELEKTTVGEKDTLNAKVRVASSNKQAIQNHNDGLYVSNDLEDFTCVFGSMGTISGQTAISILLEDRNTMKNEIILLKETINELLLEINNINNATGYKAYTNPKNMSERIDRIEENYGEEIAEEVKNIKKTLGDKENPEEGTIWYEINNIVDAGTLN